MGFVIGSNCIDVKDKSCIEECPVDCIYEGDRMLYIHPTECIDCGACEPVCPVEAIRPMQRLAEEWKPFKETRYEFADGHPRMTHAPRAAHLRVCGKLQPAYLIE